MKKALALLSLLALTACNSQPPVSTADMTLQTSDQHIDVLLAGESIGGFDTELPWYEVSEWEEQASKHYRYIQVQPDGIGGNIFYAGVIGGLWRLDGNMKLTEVWNGAGGFVTDVSPSDNSYLLRTNDADGLYYRIMDMNGKEQSVFLIPDEFDQAGNGIFSPDGTQFIYSASVVLGYNTGTTATYLVDIATGEQTELERGDAIPELSWSDKGEPVLN